MVNSVCITSMGTATSIGVLQNLRSFDGRIQITGTDINVLGYTAGSQLVDSFCRVSMATEADFIEQIRRIIVEKHLSQTDGEMKSHVDGGQPVSDLILVGEGKMSEIDLSFIVVTYNQENVVLQTLESVRHQVGKYGRGIRVQLSSVIDCIEKKYCFWQKACSHGRRPLMLRDT